MDLDDFDDLGLGTAPVKPPPSRPSRFLPKSAKLIPKQEPHHPPPPPNQPHHDPDLKPAPEPDAQPQDPVSDPMELDNEPQDPGAFEALFEDSIVREIDVFFAPRAEAGTELYVMQYPLRPSWRPYEFGEKCKEVRVHPKEGRLEVDLALDTDMNYDDNAPDRQRITKQTLASRRTPLESSYAVGVVRGSKLYLNPVDAVMQLRPSMEHLTPKALRRSTAPKDGSVSLESSAVKDSDSAKKPVKPKTGKAAAAAAAAAASSSEVVADAEESWVSLEYHGKGSFRSNQYQRKMTSQESVEIPFSIRPMEYLNSLCPVSAGAQSQGVSIKSLLAMPLEARLKRWLFEGPQLKRFAAVKHLAPNDSIEEVLEILQKHAWLVQGLWVPRSVPQNCKKQQLHRDYVIGLFQKNTVVRCSDLAKIEEYKFIEKDAKQYLSVFALYRSSSATWKLKESRDESFIESHPDVVKKQEEKWAMLEKKFMEVLRKGINDRNAPRTGPKK